MAPNVRRAFELFDANTSGSLDALELRRALVQLGLTEATNHQARNPNPIPNPEPSPSPSPSLSPSPSPSPPPPPSPSPGAESRRLARALRRQG